MVCCDGVRAALKNIIKSIKNVTFSYLFDLDL